MRGQQAECPRTHGYAQDPGARTPWTRTTVLCWFGLGVLRGTTAVMMGLGGDHIEPTVIGYLRAPGTAALFILTICIWSSRSTSSDYRSNMKQSLCDPKTYLKLATLGVLQSGGPFLLFTYGVSHVPSAFAGAFLPLVPVCTVIWDQTVFKRLGFKTGKVNNLKIAGMVVLIIGTIIFITPVFAVRFSDDINKQCDMADNDTSYNGTTLHHRDMKRLCTTTKQRLINVAELAAGCILLGFTSVYWRNFKGKIHFTLSGCGQSVVGGLVCVIAWATISSPPEFKPTFTTGSITSLLYLMVMSGYLAAMMLFYLLGQIGPVPTSRVMIIVPIVAWIWDRLLYPARGDHGVALEVTGIIVLVIGLILFEGRVDQICGINVPCYHYFTKQVQLSEASHDTIHPIAPKTSDSHVSCAHPHDPSRIMTYPQHAIAGDGGTPLSGRSSTHSDCSVNSVLSHHHLARTPVQLDDIAPWSSPPGNVTTSRHPGDNSPTSTSHHSPPPRSPLSRSGSIDHPVAVRNGK